MASVAQINLKPFPDNDTIAKQSLMKGHNSFGCVLLYNFLLVQKFDSSTSTFEGQTHAVSLVQW